MSISKIKRYTLFPIKYPDVWTMYKRAVAAFWTVEEIDLSKDNKDWDSLNKNEFILNLFYGPTFAFKDYALQLLGNLYDFILKKIRREHPQFRFLSVPLPLSFRSPSVTWVKLIIKNEPGRGSL